MSKQQKTAHRSHSKFSRLTFRATGQASGHRTKYGYDPIGQLTSAKAFEPNNTLRKNEDLGYAYDASWNLAFRTNRTLIQSFTSDPANRLQSIVREGTLTVAGSVEGPVTSVVVNTNLAELYSDNAFATLEGLQLRDGNNLFVTVGSNSVGQLVTSAITKQTLPQTVSLTYDFNGNLTGDGQRQFSYDDANQLTSVWVPGQWKSEFAYDGLNRRRITRNYTWQAGAWVKTNEVRHVCDRMLVLQERDESNVSKVTYTRGLDLSGTMQDAGGIGGLLARTDGSGTAYYHSDGAGNVAALTDSSGIVVARYLYDPFGKLLAKSGSLADANRYRFSSKEHHHSGIYHYGYRFYEPNFQRWLNEDPLREGGGLNLYEAFFNNPAMFVDPYGEDIRLQQASGPLQVPGPLGYAVGDTTIENIGSGAYNAIPLVVNGLNSAAGTMLDGFSAFDQASEGFFKWFTGDEQLGEGFNNVLMLAPLGELAKAGRVAKCVEAAKTVATPYGPAVQSMTAEAQAALRQVQSGATVYKGGVLGRSETGASQFFALENPLNPGYAGRYGLPPQNANFEFIMTGRVQPGAPVITRPAPGIPPNPGGGIEAVTTPGSFRIDSFHMP